MSTTISKDQKISFALNWGTLFHSFKDPEGMLQYMIENNLTAKEMIERYYKNIENIGIAILGKELVERAKETEF